MKLITLTLLTLMPMIVQAKPIDCEAFRILVETDTQINTAKSKKLNAADFKFIGCYGAFLKVKCELHKGEIDKITTEELEYGNLLCYKAFIEKKI